MDGEEERQRVEEESGERREAWHDSLDGSDCVFNVVFTIYTSLTLIAHLFDCFYWITTRHRRGLSPVLDGKSVE